MTFPYLTPLKRSGHPPLIYSLPELVRPPPRARKWTCINSALHAYQYRSFSCTVCPEMGECCTPCFSYAPYTSLHTSLGLHPGQSYCLAHYTVQQPIQPELNRIGLTCAKWFNQIDALGLILNPLSWGHLSMQVLAPQRPAGCTGARPRMPTFHNAPSIMPETWTYDKGFARPRPNQRSIFSTSHCKPLHLSFSQFLHSQLPPNRNNMPLASTHPCLLGLEP